MRKRTTHSKSSLFLMEMILSIFFLALACTVCVRILAAARMYRHNAREWNHIQEMTSTAGELLEGWDGDPEHFSLLFPWEMEQAADHTYESFFDKNFSCCEQENAAYCLKFLPEVNNIEKKASLTFSRSNGEIIYQLTIRYPCLSSGKEDPS